MIDGPGYPAARRVAAPLAEYFAGLQKVQMEAGTPSPDAPDADAIEQIVDAAFWASLRREEGYVPQISLAFLRPDETVFPLVFERPLAVEPVRLARLGPAVERPGIHLGVSRVDGHLAVWGTTRTIPTSCFVLEVVEPGLLVVKHRRGESGKFGNVLVLQGDLIKRIDEGVSDRPDCPILLKSLLGFDTPGSWREGVNALVELAASMRAHHHGGSLLVIPTASNEWRESILQPVAYAVAPPFTELADLMHEDTRERATRRWQDAFDRAVDAIAGLTAVDGATVMADDFEVLAFGAKIGRLDGRMRVQEIVVTEPIEGSAARVVHPGELGGTRHLSAAQFVQDQRDSIALVASQDGRFTIFVWSPHKDMVHAHRVESLLL